MQKISIWLSTNKFTLNVDKSNYLIFSTGKKKKLNLTMNNEILQEKEHTKYLGVILDNKLTWKNHITQTNLRISEGICILYKLRQCVSQSTLRSLYFAFVQSNVNYCLLNWGNAAPSNLTPIITNLNKALRIIYIGPMYHANTLYIKKIFYPCKTFINFNLLNLCGNYNTRGCHNILYQNTPQFLISTTQDNRHTANCTYQV